MCWLALVSWLLILLIIIIVANIDIGLIGFIRIRIFYSRRTQTYILVSSWTMIINLKWIRIVREVSSSDSFLVVLIEARLHKHWTSMIWLIIVAFLLIRSSVGYYSTPIQVTLILSRLTLVFLTGPLNLCWRLKILIYWFFKHNCLIPSCTSRVFSLKPLVFSFYLTEFIFKFLHPLSLFISLILGQISLNIHLF